MTTQTVQEVATNVWAEIYEALTKRGVVFPDNFDGVGAAYAGHTILANALTQERTRLKEEIEQIVIEDVPWHYQERLLHHLPSGCRR